MVVIIRGLITTVKGRTHAGNDVYESRTLENELRENIRLYELIKR